MLRRIMQIFRTKVPAHVAGIFLVGSESIDSWLSAVDDAQLKLILSNFT